MSDYLASFDEWGSVYVYLLPSTDIRDKFHKVVRLPHAEVLVDVDKDNNILGIEVLNVKIGKSKKKQGI